MKAFLTQRDGKCRVQIRKIVKFGREGNVEACGLFHRPLGLPRGRSKSGAFLVHNERDKPQKSKGRESRGVFADEKTV
jgi:hypothetical protein